MTEEPRHKHFDRSMSEWIEMVANELPDDAVGLWQIVPDGRYGFGFEGEALTEYVRHCIAELPSRDAVPVVSGGDTGYYWIEQK